MTTLDEASLQVHLHTIGVHTMLCVLFALLTAGSNACAAVLQRKAASQVPPEESMHISLIKDLIKRRVWLAGIGMVIVAAVAQAAALATGPIALVQPIFIIELPVTLVLAALADEIAQFSIRSQLGFKRAVLIRVEQPERVECGLILLFLRNHKFLSRSLNLSSPRRIRAFTVPSGCPSRAAIS